MNFIKKNRTALYKKFDSIETRRFLSPWLYNSYEIIHRKINLYLHGRTIDLGCGDLSYGEVLRQRVGNFDTIDIEKRSEGITFMGDIQNMPMVASNTYDSAICLYVFEHIKSPEKALREIYRILKNNGNFIIAVPHLCHLHEEPNDYWRFTKYGLRHMLEENGFKIVEMKEDGGLGTFFGHQISTIMLAFFWGVPIINYLVFFSNKLIFIRLCRLFDLLFDRRKIFASGYVCVATKERNDRMV